MARPRKAIVQLALPLSGLADLTVPLPPGVEKTFAVPGEWLQAPIATKLADTLDAVRRSMAENHPQDQRMSALRLGLEADRTSII